jgi:hypothetical protein
MRDGLPQQIVAEHQPFAVEIADFRQNADAGAHDAFVLRMASAASTSRTTSCFGPASRVFATTIACS